MAEVVGSTNVIALNETGGVTATILRVPNHAIVKRIIPLMMTENAVAIGSRLPAIRSGTATGREDSCRGANFRRENNITQAFDQGSKNILLGNLAEITAKPEVWV